MNSTEFRKHAAVLLLFAAFAVAMTWPLIGRMSDAVLGAKYYWDAYTNTMIMGARTLNAVGEGAGGVYEDFFMSPIKDSIVFNENLFGLSLLFAPFYGLTGNPLLAYNIVLLISLALSGYFMFLFVRHLTGSELAGLISGVAFAFCPYTLFEIGRIQLVANQWIPLTFLFLHRAIEGQRTRDIVGLGVTYALQVGTCLYYAMFLLPLVAFVGAWLLWVHRPATRRFWAQLVAVGAATGAVVLAMIYPYFTSRKNFSLERADDFAQGFDGKLSFLFNVHDTNQVWRVLRHSPELKTGAHEEIAFPGLVIGVLALSALVVPLATALGGLDRRARAQWALSFLLVWGGAVAIGSAAVLMTHTFLPLLLTLAAGGALWLRKRGETAVYTSNASMYGWLLVFVLALFIGMAPFESNGTVVKGLYHYLHTYVPGFNGIRKVSRQAIMVMLSFAVLAGFGAAMLGRWLPKGRPRAFTFGVLMLVIPLEYWSAPMKLVTVPSGDRVSKAYEWIANQDTEGPIGVVPAQDGVRKFRGHRGGALHNYLSLYHQRRTLNGKSSFVPPVTHLFRNAARRMPSGVATRIFQQLNMKYLVVHTADMKKTRAKAVLAGLREDTLNYVPVFSHGKDHVFELKKRSDPTLKMLTTPELPGDLVAVPKGDLSAGASRWIARTENAFDGDPKSKWATRTNQRVGDWFEFRLKESKRVAAVDMTDFSTAYDAPLGFLVEVATEKDDWKKVLVRSHVQMYEEQVHRPKDFVFRVVFPEPVLAQRIRFTILDPVPGRWWSIHEATIWVDASSN